MSFTDTLSIQYNLNGTPVTKEVQATGSSIVQLQEAFADDDSDLEIVAAIDVSALELLIVEATADCTVETNSASTPDNTLTLTAGVPVIWYPGCGHSNPLTADVTSLFVNPTAATAGVLSIKALTDATPPAEE